MQVITKNAMITIMGRPNVGKSTLINALIGEKIAAVSKKPQTTRRRILGVKNIGETQLIFADTPGFHKPRTKLGEQMVAAVRESVADNDASVLVIDPKPELSGAEEALIERIKALGTPCILAINKIDIISPVEILPVIDLYSKRYDFAALIPISALTGTGLDELVKELIGYSREGPALFPEDTVTDQLDSTIVAEIIREKLLMNLDREVPHGITVNIVKFGERGEEDDPVIDIDAEIICEKKTHKGIIIGKNGSVLKTIGTEARFDIEHFMGARVNLQTWVKVREGWRDSVSAIRSYGLSE